MRISTLPRRAAVALIDFYRAQLSARKRAPTCRFVPTCSQYAREAIVQHGLVCGGGLALWRILRCNPFCKGGYDPVPPKRGSAVQAAEPLITKENTDQ